MTPNPASVDEWLGHTHLSPTLLQMHVGRMLWNTSRFVIFFSKILTIICQLQFVINYLLHHKNHCLSVYTMKHSVVPTVCRAVREPLPCWKREMSRAVPFRPLGTHHPAIRPPQSDGTWNTRLEVLSPEGGMPGGSGHFQKRGQGRYPGGEAWHRKVGSI